MIIKQKLLSKSDKEHHISRYITYLENCKQVNDKSLPLITESHHILPKSLYPEYKLFRLNPWNKVNLTPRQHIIAHILLCKIFPSDYHCTFAVVSMRNKNGHKITTREYQRLREQFITNQRARSIEMHKNMSSDTRKRRIEKLSKASKNKVQSINSKGERCKISKVVFDADGTLVGHTKGMITAKDASGNIISISKDDPRWISNEYVGIQKGTKPSDELKLVWSKQRKGKKKSEEMKAKLRKSKGPQRKVICPHCQKEGGVSNMQKYHFDNCKSLIS